MFRWNSPFGLRYDESKARRPKNTVKLRLEGLEDRTMPSAALMNPLAFQAVASPPPVPSMAAVTSYLASTMDQWNQIITTVQQDLLAAWKTLGQEFAQEVSAVQQRWDHLVGINPNAPNPSLNTTVTQLGSGIGRGNSSGSGSGSSASTTHNVSNQQVNTSTQPSGRGSGSGSSSTATHPIILGQNGTKVHPLLEPGSGSGPATVYGEVWLDNNGDGSINNGEQGLPGVTVNLIYTPTQQLVGQTVTDPNGLYQFKPTVPPPPDDTYQIDVISPFGDEPTKQTGTSQIDSQGFSFVFALAPGGAQQIIAGMRSMNVNTPDDDPNGALKGKITLRDAIQTGNNGPPPNVTAVTFFTAPNVALNGTINLQAKLDPIQKSYDIQGPGSSNLTVQGNANANNPYSIFTVNVGVTTTISGLTIKGGYANAASGGGGILSQGKLALKGDIITGNTAPASGGGLYVNGGTVTVSGGSISNNTAALQNGGGIYVNVGTLKIKDKVLISLNGANGVNGNGGGTYIYQGKVTMTGGAIDTNTSGVSGGGIYNNAGTLTLNNGVNITSNIVLNQGGGMYLGKASTTTFNGCTVGGPGVGAKNIAKKAGNGIYWQNFAAVNGLPAGLNDWDDPGGTPVTGA